MLTRRPAAAHLRPLLLRRTLIPQPAPSLVAPRPLPSTFLPGSSSAQSNRDGMSSTIAAHDALLSTARLGGGPDALAKWRARAASPTSAPKLSARERVNALLDPSSPFLELSPLAAHEVYPDPLPGAGIITGIGTVDGRKLMIVANDPTVKGGAYHPLTVKKHLRAQQVALENKLPCVYLVESGGAALPYQAEVFPDHKRAERSEKRDGGARKGARDGAYRQDHFGRIFYNMARMSALGIPQISVVHGISVAGGAYMPAMSDVVIIVKSLSARIAVARTLCIKVQELTQQNQGRIFLAGPPLVKAATGEVVDEETLGGGEMHTSVSGVADYLAHSDAHAIKLAREAVRDLGVKPKRQARPAVRPPAYPTEDLNAIIPSDPRQSYDPREVIARLTDGSEFREFKSEYGKTIITGFAEVHGHTVGIIANNGVLLSPSALKATHFIELCSQRGIPLLFLVNVTGYMVGEKAERGGIAKDGAKMVRAVARAKVPKFTVVTGGTYGAGNYGMCGRAYSPRFLWMWPNAKICVMGPDQLASVMDSVSGKSKSKSTSTAAADTAAKEQRSAALRERIENESSALYSTARLWDDGIIKPSDTRDVLGLALELAEEEKMSRSEGVGGAGGTGARGEIGADGDAGGWGVFRM